MVTGVVPFFPPALTFNFYHVSGSEIPLLVDFSSNAIANSRSRAFRKPICSQQKAPTNLYEYALGGTRTIYTRLEDNLIRHRGDRA